MKELLSKLSAWRPFRVVVVGDFMLDETVLGDAERLTGDAPVPVLHVRETTRTPGGAANVCMNLAALGAEVTAVGVVGDDAEGRAVRSALESQGVRCEGLIVDGSRPTTVKRSLVGRAQHRHPQKMFRVDIECTDALGGEARSRLLQAFERSLVGAEIVAVEDYDKGVLRGGVCVSVIDRCRSAGIEVIVDPARLSDYSRYRGATSITPNRSEAETATGLPTHESADMESNAALARSIQDSHGIHAVVLTLDRHGALLLERGCAPLAVATVAREVYDVTGAGDMVLAALAAGRANGLDWASAVRLANVAAGLEVEVFGVQPIPLDRIRREVARCVTGAHPKFFTRDELASEVARRRAAGQRIVFTNGCFDVLHSGHVMLIEEARRLGDFLIVAINTDAKVREFKGPSRPVNNEHDRAVVLSGLQSVDAVTIFEEDTPAELIERLRPDVLVKGAEYSAESIPGASRVESWGGRVVRVPMKAGMSSSRTIRQMGIDAAKVELTAEMRDRFARDRAREAGRSS
ncbi:MAG: D-glycero-beta-D-manno-heptose 1-phosphate adenylyltransferase [Phycisphaerae bacterium]|nr:D-glycero-beta-D-manno-heptose 1-phosphate adenylyltransferase [Phycisphaerae bacterium]